MQNTIKKCLSLLLACLMIMSVATVAFADGGTLTVGTGSGKAGGDVDIPVTLNAGGVTNGVFKISYDKDVLTYKSANTATFDEKVVDTETAGTIKFAFANKETAVAADTALITVTFTIKEGATVGASTVTAVLEAADDAHHLQADGFFGANGDAVAVSITAGSVTVEEEEEEILYGDLNGDDEVDLYDEIILSRYNAGWDGYEEDTFNYDAADLNGDDEVDLYDEIILSRYNAGWDGYEDLPLLD